MMPVKEIFGELVTALVGELGLSGPDALIEKINDEFSDILPREILDQVVLFLHEVSGPLVIPYEELPGWPDTLGAADTSELVATPCKTGSE